MKKVSSIVLALALCAMSTAYAKTITDPAITTKSGDVAVDVDASGTYDATLGYTNINWSSFDIKKGQTVTFYNIQKQGGPKDYKAAVLNTITSNKVSSLDGTITATSDNNSASTKYDGSVGFFNAKGFNIGKNFAFKGVKLAFYVANPAESNDYVFGVNTLEDKAFDPEGTLRISAKGAVSGNLKVADFNGDIIIQAEDQNVTLGDITAHGLEITGKNVKTGALTLNGRGVDIEGTTITVKSVTGGRDEDTVNLTAEKSVRVNGDLVASSATIEAQDVFLKDVDVVKFTIEADRNVNVKNLTADFVALNAKSFTAKSVDLEDGTVPEKGIRVESFNVGKLTADTSSNTQVFVTKKFSLGKGTDVKGKLGLYYDGDGKNPILSIAKDSQFTKMYFLYGLGGGEYTMIGHVKDATALKQVTARNFDQEGTWDPDFISGYPE